MGQQLNRDQRMKRRGTCLFEEVERINVDFLGFEYYHKVEIYSPR
jgi:hypothetical protein